MNWIFVSIDIDLIASGGGWRKGNFGCNSEKIILSVGSALHFSDGSVIVVHICGKGVSCRTA